MSVTTSSYLKLGVRALRKDWGLIIVRGGAVLASQALALVPIASVFVWGIVLLSRMAKLSLGLFDFLGGFFHLLGDWRLYAVLASALLLGRLGAWTLLMMSDAGSVGVLAEGTRRPVAARIKDFFSSIGQKVGDYLLVTIAGWLLLGGAVLWGFCGWVAGQLMVQDLSFWMGDWGVLLGSGVIIFSVMVGTLLAVGAFLVGTFARIVVFFEEDGVGEALVRSFDFVVANLDPLLKLLTGVGLVWMALGASYGLMQLIVVLVPPLAAVQPMTGLLFAVLGAAVWVWTQGCYVAFYAERTGLVSADQMREEPPPAPAPSKLITRPPGSERRAMVPVVSSRDPAVPAAPINVFSISAVFPELSRPQDDPEGDFAPGKRTVDVCEENLPAGRDAPPDDEEDRVGSRVFGQDESTEGRDETASGPDSGSEGPVPAEQPWWLKKKR